MNRDEILSASSMPLFSPSYSRGPYRFVNREYLLIDYETDPDIIRHILPEPLQPDGNRVYYEWMKMPDATSFGSYIESGAGIHCLYEGKPALFSVQMYLNDEPPITGGREIWGFPKKYGVPKLGPVRDTFMGTLHYDNERIAMGTMTWKENELNKDEVKKGLEGLNVNLKWIPDVDGKPKIAQLVGYNLENIVVKGAWSGDARLHLVPHVRCRLADMPVRKIIGGKHFLVDFTLPYGRVLHDYLA